MRAALAIVATLALTACGHDTVKPDLPGVDTVVAPKIVYVDRIVYVRVPPALTQPEPMAEGPIAQCFTVAAERRAALDRCNSKLKRIDAIQGTEAKP